MDKDKDTENQDVDPITDLLDNVLFGGGTLVLIFVVLVVVSILVSTLGSNGSESQSFQQEDNAKTNNLFIIMIAVIIGLLLLVGGVRYLFGTSVYTTIEKTSTGTEIDVVVDHKTLDPSDTPDDPSHPDTPEPASSGDQVFNIPGNYFGYSTAKNLCTAYGARLARYDEVEQAYENGAEWCNYGWSEDQLALFPTQKDTYDKLQTIPGHENDCGRPGINGGYMKNPNVKYGVNCYGKKPAITPDEQFIMENGSPYPQTRKDIANDNEIDRLKKNLGDLIVSPFNKQRWSKY